MYPKLYRLRSRLFSQDLLPVRRTMRLTGCALEYDFTDRVKYPMTKDLEQEQFANTRTR